ncbi:MAG TPA: diadenylate cyclase CdaA [Lacrimispora saccharolytica]|uniref:diadenylate cyclase CdaA n=1 Tax=Clostridium sp. M62/1 TaxID=411486 RepID=UPI00174844BC|nr:diadenylate cyclase CdaA [Lacrimispora saccharolytica]
MAEYLKELYSWIAFVPNMTLKNLLEIVIIAFVVYEVLVWIKNTRAWTLLKGILFICAFALAAAVLELDTILWLLGKASYIAITALLIIFQPELRRALEQLGSKNVLTGLFANDDGKVKETFSEKTINELTRACFEMGKVKTGALMVIEMETSLSDVERTGIEVDGIITSQLLINIFEHNTPLHDGAVVIRGNRVTAATCYLPLSDNMDISKDLGTRHRAAVGISEVTDSLTLVVSEETGRVSVASGGRLIRVSDAEQLKEILSRAVKREETTAARFKIWKGRRKNERKAD